MSQTVPLCRTLLVELLTEELPPKALARLAEAFAGGLASRLAAADLIEAPATADPAPATCTIYATPRRLAVAIHNVRSVSPARQVRQKVLPVSVALDANGQPTAPLAKKLAALGFPDIGVDELERAPDGKTEAFFLSHTAPGRHLADVLQAALTDTLARLPVPKMMRYQRYPHASQRVGPGSGAGVATDAGANTAVGSTAPAGVQTVDFARPVHRLLALHGADLVPVSAFGLPAGRATLGHRFMSSGEIAIDTADHYAALLEQRGRVIASQDERRASIERQLLAAAGADRVVMPAALVDEVSALVEWPKVYACSFDAAFLEVPQECLILTMQTNQKYFALTDADGRLRPRFLVVSNIDTATPADIIEGNERVIRPRLADARFFFRQDKKKPLAERVSQLGAVVYHNKLGSQLQRTQRVVAIAEAIAPRVGADVARAARGALLAKADLTTDMVGEFPELQGTMGTYYARHDGEADEVALACSEHYRPRFSGDALPATLTGTVVALADKLETLVGIWGIGLAPTGEKDPFALRRHALGVLRILIEKALPLDLLQLLQVSYAQFATLPAVSDPVDALRVFFLDRLRAQLRERGYSANEVEAVLAEQPTRFDDIIGRLDAVRAFAALPEADALAAANKRIGNILKKADAAAIPASVDAARLVEPAEQALFADLQRVAPLAQAHRDAGRYAEALSALAGLRGSVDAFFNDVMVNAEDAALRANRLALLAQLHRPMNAVADISKLAS
ncbi:glycine--tRNA ligase subunit beta [Robbsia sp. Bb-Pol-6]|uniref:Glycine--tRNA ligase beta subunit n=1 Tax=Robbsia betulipollinis TaxID=2981849 RepID=A0ABT3ZM71_9BURK|nr:glycine--tRNA ligase subunit beta [Robbsia betulipollinis]MCY0387375.1 glycine--tRNA ligase subunit beta [Robbsia betulipollinis]